MEQIKIDLQELLALRMSIKSKRQPETRAYHPDELNPDPNNPRKDLDNGIEAIRESYKANGFMPVHPLEVDADTNTVLAGNRREAAAKGMPPEWQTENLLVAWCYVGLTDLEKVIIATESNERRIGLSFSERAAHVVNLIDVWGLTFRAAAMLMGEATSGGMKKSNAQKYYMFGKYLVPEVQHAVDKGTIKQNCAALLGQTDSRGELIYPFSEQMGIIQDPRIRGMKVSAFSAYLERYLENRDALRADKSQLGLEFDGISCRPSDDGCEVASPDTERRWRKAANKVMNRIDRMDVMRLDINNREAFLRKELGKGADTAAMIIYLSKLYTKRQATAVAALRVLADMGSSAKDEPAAEGVVPVAGPAVITEEQAELDADARPEAGITVIDSGAQTPHTDTTGMRQMRAPRKKRGEVEPADGTGFTSPMSSPAKKVHRLRPETHPS